MTLIPAITDGLRTLWLSILLLSGSVWANVVAYELVIKDHLFYPSELTVPAFTQIKLVIHNQGETSEEFESLELNREKIIGPNRTAVIYLGPLEPGDYPFFGEFNPKSAQGVLHVISTSEPN